MRRNQRTAVLCLAAAAIALSQARPARAGAPCPVGGATLIVRIDNQSGATSTVRVKGSRASGTCDETGLGLSLNYDSTSINCLVGATDCYTKMNLAPGIYRNEVTVSTPSQSPYQNQKQYIESLVVGADPQGDPARLTWTVFKTVRTVTRTDDPTGGSCGSGSNACSLRQAVAAGATVPSPLLVQFDTTVFPPATPSGGTTIALTQSSNLTLSGSGMWIDGRDSNGEPSIFFPDPGKYSRIVDIQNASARFVLTSANGGIAGLEIKRTTGGTPEDVVVFSGSGAQRNTLINSRVDGGATGYFQAKDVIEALGGAGGNFSQANRVSKSVVTNAPDKGIKAAGAGTYLIVEDSHIHHNFDGGVQATLEGNVEANRNIIEYSGYNAAGTEVRDNANGLSIQGPASGPAPVLNSLGNIIRYQTLRGISVRSNATSTITNDYVCGSDNAADTGGLNGIAIFNDGGTPTASATLRGTTAVYNGRNGVTVDNTSTIDAGTNTGTAAGNNAFTRNRTVISSGRNFSNDTDNGSTISAVYNQWENCGTGASCNNTAIGSSDIAGSVTYTPTQPQRNAVSPNNFQIASFAPSQVPLQNDLVRIIGRGFNAIDGHPSGGTCASPATSNTCSPLSGVCVEFELTAGTFTPATVVSVTPQQIVVKYPSVLGCAKPMTVRVTQKDEFNNPESTTGTFCTNP